MLFLLLIIHVTNTWANHVLIETSDDYGGVSVPGASGSDYEGIPGCNQGQCYQDPATKSCYQ